MTLEGANAFCESNLYTIYTMNSATSGQYAVAVPKNVVGTVNMFIDFHEKSLFDSLVNNSKTKEDLIKEVNDEYDFIKKTYPNFMIVFPMFEESDYINVVNSNDKQKMFDEVKKVGAITSEIYKKLTTSGVDASSIDQKIIILEKTSEDKTFIDWLKGQMPNYVDSLTYVKVSDVVSNNPFMSNDPFASPEVKEEVKVVENNATGSIFDSNSAVSSPVAEIPVTPIPEINPTLETAPVSNDIFGGENTSKELTNNIENNSNINKEQEVAPQPVNNVELEGTTAFRPLPGDTTKVEVNNDVVEPKTIEEVQASHNASKGIANLLILVVILVGVTFASIELGKYLYSVYGG